MKKNSEHKTVDFHFNEKGVITVCNNKFMQIANNNLHSKIKSFIKESLTGKIIEFTHTLNLTGSKDKVSLKICVIPMVVNNIVLGGIGIIEDISKDKILEHSLRESKEELTIKNSIASVFLTADEDEVYAKILNIILHNIKSKYGLFGYLDDNGDLVCPSLTREVYEACKMEDKNVMISKNRLKGIFKEVIDKKQIICSNTSFAVPKGHVSIFNAMAAPIIYRKAVIGIIIIGNKDGGYTDIDKNFMKIITDYISPILKSKIDKETTEKMLRRKEEELQQSQKMEAIGRLASGVAHDFNNILTAIMGYSDLILGELSQNDPKKSDILEIKNAAQRGSSLTSQLLMVSRKHPVNPIIVNLNKIVSEMSKMLKRLIGEKIKLILSLDPALYCSKLDTGQMEQIIINLAVNARDSMPDGGKLVIKTKNMIVEKEQCEFISDARPGKFVCMFVSDTGKGMSELTVTRIFEPFFTTKPKGKGSGLGLSMVYGIVKQHRGWINVYSNIGMGTTFKIYFPAVIENPGKESQKLKTQLNKLNIKGNGKRVLIVEDEKEVYEFAARALNRNEYKVFGASTAKEAMEIFKNEKGDFHLIFSDIGLPDRNGIELIDELLSKNPKLKVILSSGYTGEESCRLSAQEKGISFLQKPYSLMELLTAVKRLI